MYSSHIQCVPGNRRLWQSLQICTFYETPDNCLQKQIMLVHIYSLWFTHRSNKCAVTAKVHELLERTVEHRVIDKAWRSLVHWLHANEMGWQQKTTWGLFHLLIKLWSLFSTGNQLRSVLFIFIDTIQFRTWIFLRVSFDTFAFLFSSMKTYLRDRSWRPPATITRRKPRSSCKKDRYPSTWRGSFRRSNQKICVRGNFCIPARTKRWEYEKVVL